MTAYYRVTLRPGERPFYLEVESERGDLLFGTEVDKHGVPVEPKDADERKHLLDKRIAHRVVPARMNLKYQELETS